MVLEFLIEFLDLLDKNESAITVIFSALVATATIVYAILTWRLVSETRSLREAQTEPKISVTIQPREEWLNFMDMIVQNHGFGPAHNLQFIVNPDFEYFAGMFLSEIGFLKNGLKYLAPNQKIQFFLTDLTENYEEKIKNSFEIKVTYQNSIGTKYEDLYLIDFSQFINFSQLGEPPLHKIAEKIERIQKDIKAIASGSHKMKVIMYTKNEEEEEIKQKRENFSSNDKK